MSSVLSTTSGFLDRDNEVLWQVFSQCSPFTKLSLFRSSRRFKDIMLHCNEGVKLHAPPFNRPNWTDDQYWDDIQLTVESTRRALDKASEKTKPLVQLNIAGLVVQKDARHYTQYRPTPCMHVEHLLQRLSTGTHLRDLSRLHLNQISMRYTNLNAFVDTFPQLTHLVLQHVLVPWLSKHRADLNTLPVVPAVHKNLKHLELLDCTFVSNKKEAGNDTIETTSEQMGSTSTPEQQSAARNFDCAALSLPCLSSLVIREEIYLKDIADCFNPVALRSLAITRRAFRSSYELQAAAVFENIEHLTMDTHITDFDMECIFRLPSLQHLHLSLFNLRMGHDYSLRQWRIKTLVFTMDSIGSESIQTLRKLPLNTTPRIEVAPITRVTSSLLDAEVVEFASLTQRFTWPTRQPGSFMLMIDGSQQAAQLLKYVDTIQVSNQAWPYNSTDPLMETEVSELLNLMSEPIPVEPQDTDDPLVQAILSESQYRHITYVPFPAFPENVAHHVRSVIPPMCSYRGGMVLGPQPALLTADIVAETIDTLELIAEVLDLVCGATRGYISISKERAKQQLAAWFSGPHEAIQQSNHMSQLKQATLEWVNQGDIQGLVDVLYNLYGIEEMKVVKKLCQESS